MDQSIIVDLNEEPAEDGAFRTRNERDQKFRPNLVDRGNSLFTKVDIVGITHGKFSKTAEYATLLVFELRFIATGGRRFKQAAVTFQFDDAERQATRDPVVHDIAPKDIFALNKTEKVQHIKLGVNSGINIGIDAAGAQAGILWEIEETQNRTFYTALSGQKKTVRKGWTGEENTVIWRLEENGDREDGIPTFLRAAVLLRRKYDVPFSLAVNVKADVDFVGKVKTFFGLERTDPIDPVEIDPSTYADTGRATISSLDPKLHDLAQMDHLCLKKVADVLVVTLLDRDTI